MRVRLSLATLAATIATGCATGPYDNRQPWEVAVQATPQANGFVHVRTYTLAPTACYAPAEIRTAPSTRPESIQVQTVLAARGGACAEALTEVVHDAPNLRLEPDDRYLEIVVSADGVERNRVIVDLATAPPVGTGYYDPAYPRDPRYTSPPYGS